LASPVERVALAYKSRAKLFHSYELLPFGKIAGVDHDQGGVGKVVVKSGFCRKKLSTYAGWVNTNSLAGRQAAAGTRRTGGCVVFEMEPLVEASQAAK
jgi:hypothetical protein